MTEAALIFLAPTPASGWCIGLPTFPVPSFSPSNFPVFQQTLIHDYVKLEGIFGSSAYEYFLMPALVDCRTFIGWVIASGTGVSFGQVSPPG